MLACARVCVLPQLLPPLLLQLPLLLLLLLFLLLLPLKLLVKTLLLAMAALVEYWSLALLLPPFCWLLLGLALACFACACDFVCARPCSRGGTGADPFYLSFMCLRVCRALPLLAPELLARLDCQLLSV